MKKDSSSIKHSSGGLSKEEIKKRFLESLVYNGNFNTNDLNEWANIVGSCEELMDIIKEYEDIVKTSKNNIIFFA